MKNRRSGFTLIELMIAVAVIAILAAVAYPSYTDYIRRGNRVAAQSLLQDLAQRQQQYFAQTRGFAADLAADLGVTIPADVAKNYTVTVAVQAGPPPGYTLTATPKSGTVQAPDPTLSIDATGAKSPAGAW